MKIIILINCKQQTLLIIYLPKTLKTLFLWKEAMYRNIRPIVIHFSLFWKVGIRVYRGYKKIFEGLFTLKFLYYNLFLLSSVIHFLKQFYINYTCTFLFLKRIWNKTFWRKIMIWSSTVLIKSINELAICCNKTTKQHKKIRKYID